MSATAHRPAALRRSIPFWVLVGGSAVTAGAGVLLLTDTLSRMSVVLLDGSATGVDVYVGQVWAVLGAILVGAGVLGLALSLVVASLGGLLRRPLVDEAPADDTDGFGYERDLGYAEVEGVDEATPEPTASDTDADQVSAR